MFKSVTDMLRFERTKKRAKRQVELNEICEYDLTDEVTDTTFTYDMMEQPVNGKYHLLSEGVVVDINGEPYNIIARGSIKEWYDQLDENLHFDIDLAHKTENPIFRQIGTWSKRDLSLVEQADGRYSLYTDLNLDEESLVVKELRRKGINVGLSVEFASSGRYVDLKGEPVYCHDHINIVGFGVVGEPQDAKSGNIVLNEIKETEKGAYSLNKSEFMNGLKNLFSVKKDEPEAVEETVEEVVEEATQEEPEVVEEVVEESVETVEEVVEEAAEPEVETEPEAPEQPEFVTYEVLMEAIKPIVEATQANADATAELSGRIKQINSFSVGASTETKQHSTDRVGF